MIAFARHLSLVVILLSFVCWSVPPTSAQQTDALKKQFLKYKAKAEKGDAKAQFMAGYCYYAGEGVEKDYVEAVKWYRKAAEQNYSEAQVMLAVCYAKGRGVDGDYVEAMKWYHKSAELNNFNAQFVLGGCYADGRGVNKDTVEAYAWFSLAAELSVRDARQPGLEFREAVDARDKLEKQMSPQQVAEGRKRIRVLRALFPKLNTPRAYLEK